MPTNASKHLVDRQTFFFVVVVVFGLFFILWSLRFCRVRQPKCF